MERERIGSVTAAGVSTARRGAGALTLFLELFFFRRAEARGRTERFAVVEQRQIAHVKRQRARGGLLVDDDGDGTAFDAVAEGDAASAGEPTVREPLQHFRIIISRAPCRRTRPRKSRAGQSRTGVRRRVTRLT